VQLPYRKDTLWPSFPRRLFCVVGGVMFRPRPYDFYTFASFVHPVGALQAGEPFKASLAVFEIVSNAQAGCAVFGFDDFCKKYLPAATERAADLGRYLTREILQKVPERISKEQAESVREMVHAFETSLQDELAKAPVFCCEDEKIGNYSVDKLLKGASNGYAAKTRTNLTSACLTEIDEAGRCLIYDRSTAAGFHMLRSIEITIRQYLLAIPGFQMPPLNRQNWGEYLQLLRNNSTAKEVTDHLQNIKDNYRNPLMHPEDTLEIDEAVSLFGVAQSMNEMLIADMKKRGTIQCQTKSSTSSMP
jgi:hypothetical protein